MRTKIGLGIAGLLAAVGLSVGVALAVGLPGTASAGDPPPGMHQACQQMAPNAMGPMHAGMMNAGGQMGGWMASPDHCPH